MAIDRRKRFWILGVLACVAIALVIWAVVHKPAAKDNGPRPVPVTAVRAAARDFPLSFTTLGSAQAWTSDTILAQVSGKLLRVHFTEGGDVHAGQLLAEVDPAPYQAALAQALGTLRRDSAILAGSERDLAHYHNLLAVNSIAKQTVEDEEATVAQQRGTVQLDQGLVAAARVNLGWCRIISPISGRAGVRLVDPGNLVSASGSAASAQSTAAATSSAAPTSSAGSGIVVINQLQPIAVTFTIPEGEFEHLSQLSSGFTRALPVKAYSQESGELLDSGELRIADNKVDQATGTVELKARFTNAGKRLWPGQFVNVSLATETLPHAVVIPTVAVNRGPKGAFVFVIGKDGKALVRPVTIAGAAGTLTAITSGISAGDAVVTDGQMTLKAGSPVRITRPAAPAAGA